MAQLDDRRKVELVRQHREGVPWTRIAAHSGVSVRTLQRWAARLDAGRLARPTRRDKGTMRTSVELVRAIEALALRRPPPTIAYIHRRIGDIARDRGLPAPGYTTVRGIVHGVDLALRVIADGGEAAYRDKFELVYRRTTGSPNEQWQMDHTLLDVLVVDERGRPVRPWLTVVLDDFSRAVAGYSLAAVAPTADHSALALHQAVSRKRRAAWVVSGLPEALYVDHGADFTSTRIERVCLELHVQLIHSRVGVPQGRGKVERFYRTITTELLPHLPGFIPHGSRGTPSTSPTLTMRELDDVLERFIVGEYNERRHSSTGVPPHARWRSNGFIPRTPQHPEDIDDLLLTAATTRRVQRDGIQFASTRYISPVLAAYVGEDVTVRYDPRDLGEVRVFHDNDFLCRAIAPERSTETVSFADLRAARNTQRRIVKRQFRDLTALAGSLPTDSRHRNGAHQGPEEATPEPLTPPPPTHGLRIYVDD